MKNTKNKLALIAALSVTAAFAPHCSVSAAVPVRAVYNEFTAGASSAEDSYIGRMRLLSSNLIAPVTPDAANYNCSWEAVDNTYTGDGGIRYTEFEGRNTVMTSRYHRPGRANSPVTNGFIYFDAGADITTEDRSLTVDIDYFDVGTAKLGFLYVNGAASGNFRTVTADRTDSYTWRTATFSITDAYLNRSSHTGLADGKSDFRVESNGIETYVSGVTVHNCSKEEYETLTEAAAALSPEIPTRAVDDFTLPDSAGDCSVTWQSSSDAAMISGSLAVIERKASDTPVTLTAYVTVNDSYYLTKEFAFTVAAAPYEAPALTFGEASDSVNDGKYTLSVPVKHADTESGQCKLLLASYDKTTGKLNGIVSSAHTLGTEPSFTITAQTEYSTNNEYRYYMLRQNGSSLKNAPPASVIPEISAKNRKITVEWKKPADDFDAISAYSVKVNGSEATEIPGNSDTLKYEMSDALDDREYTVSVIARDHGGALSRPYEVSAKLEPMLSVDLADCSDISGGLTFLLSEDIDAGDNYTEQTECDGVVCRKNVNRKPLNDKSLTFLYFSTDKKLLSSDDRNVTIEITYYDKGNGSLVVQYNAADGSVAKTVTAAQLTATDTWKTVLVRLTDAMFVSPPALTNCDFRITGAGGTTSGEVYISRVRAIQTEKY